MTHYIVSQKAAAAYHVGAVRFHARHFAHFGNGHLQYALRHGINFPRRENSAVGYRRVVNFKPVLYGGEGRGGAAYAVHIKTRRVESAVFRDLAENKF